MADAVKQLRWIFSFKDESPRLIDRAWAKVHSFMDMLERSHESTFGAMKSVWLEGSRVGQSALSKIGHAIRAAAGSMTSFPADFATAMDLLPPVLRKTGQDFARFRVDVQRMSASTRPVALGMARSLETVSAKAAVLRDVGIHGAAMSASLEDELASAGNAVANFADVITGDITSGRMAVERARPMFAEALKGLFTHIRPSEVGVDFQDFLAESIQTGVSSGNPKAAAAAKELFKGLGDVVGMQVSKAAIAQLSDQTIGDMGAHMTKALIRRGRPAGELLSGGQEEEPVGGKMSSEISKQLGIFSKLGTSMRSAFVPLVEAVAVFRLLSKALAPVAEIAQNALMPLFIPIQEALADLMLALRPIIMQLVPALQEGMSELIPPFVEIAREILPMLMDALLPVFKVMVQVAGALAHLLSLALRIPAVSVIVKALVGALVLYYGAVVIGKGVTLAIASATWAYHTALLATRAVTWTVTAATWAWNAALYANPAVWIAAAVLALVAGLVYLVYWLKKSIGWWALLAIVVAPISSMFGIMLAMLKGIAWVVDKLGKALGIWGSDTTDKAGKAASRIGDAADQTARLSSNLLSLNSASSVFDKVLKGMGGLSGIKIMGTVAASLAAVPATTGPVMASLDQGTQEILLESSRRTESKLDAVLGTLDRIAGLLQDQKNDAPHRLLRFGGLG